MNKYREAIKWLEEIFALMGGEFVGDHRKSLQELVDKATPKKVIGEKGYSKCPNCETSAMGKYCYECGQALDWSEDE